MRKLIAALAVALFSTGVFAQSSPGLVYGQVPSAAQWNSYFAAKQDLLVGAPYSVLGNKTGSSLAPTWLTVPNCSGGNQAVTWTNNSGFGCNTFIAAGNVIGPGSATVGYIPTWGNTGGTLLANGLPVGTGGASTVVETTAGGLLSLSIIPQISTAQVPTGKSVIDPGTGVLESVVPIQTTTGSSKTFTTVDLQLKTRRSNSGTAMTDTFPSSVASGLANGALINVANADATASDTITAGAGTTICGSGSCASTFVLTPGRDVQWAYDLANTAWRPMSNTATALLGPNNLSDLLSASTARTNLGLGTAAVDNIGTSGATIPLNNGNNTSSGNQTHTGTETFSGTATFNGTISGTAAFNIGTNSQATLTQTTVSVSAASSQLIASNSSRKTLRWMVVGANDVTIVPGASSAVFGTGFIYQAQAANKQGSSETFASVVPTNAFQVVCNTGLSSTIIVWEGN